MKFFGRYGGIEYYYSPTFLYAKKDGELLKLALFDKRFFKLRLYNRVPILEIDGVRMHLVGEFPSPLEYANEVTRSLRIVHDDVVLDTCMGLGYMAIAAAKNAEKVITCELHPAVLQLAKRNPFSRDLFHSKKIEIHQGDVASIINGFKEKTFDVVVHDPPRFSHAPQLYSAAFYRELMRIGRRGARFFHYVGRVGHQRGRSMENEVARRLEQCGFRDVRYHSRLQGLLFRKG